MTPKPKTKKPKNPKHRTMSFKKAQRLRDEQEANAPRLDCTRCGIDEESCKIHHTVCEGACDERVCDTCRLQLINEGEWFVCEPHEKEPHFDKCKKCYGEENKPLLHHLRFDCGCIDHNDDAFVRCESCGYKSCLDHHHIDSTPANVDDWKCYEGYGCMAEGKRYPYNHIRAVLNFSWEPIPPRGEEE